jgi:hypothetical protein
LFTQRAFLCLARQNFGLKDLFPNLNLIRLFHPFVLCLPLDRGNGYALYLRLGHAHQGIRHLVRLRLERISRLAD